MGWDGLTNFGCVRPGGSSTKGVKFDSVKTKTNIKKTYALELELDVILPEDRNTCLLIG